MSEADLRGWVVLNGHMLPAHRAQVSVFDRGFQYGDGLIETLRVDRGCIVAWDAHLARMRASAASLAMEWPSGDWAAAVARLLRRNRLEDGEAWVRLTLTRGTSARGMLPARGGAPTWLVAAGEVDAGVVQARRRGVRVVTLGFGRGAALAEHKHAFYLPSIAGKREAAAAGAFDGLFVERGAVQGATTANLFALVGDVLLTPRAPGVLPGITRARTAAAARAAGLRVAERRVGVDTLARATEVFLTNSVFELVPVVRVDGGAVGGGRPGPVARALQRALGVRIPAKA